jgi:hypothetical protein
MSAGSRIVSRTCTGTGRSVYEWANSERPGDDGRAPCPVCGKRVLIERKTGKMPTHAPLLGRVSRIVNVTKDKTMTDTPTPETPAELAARILAVFDKYVPMDVAPIAGIAVHRLATLAASSTAPAGFVLVPVTLTDDMLHEAWRGLVGACDHTTIREAYRRMLAAAPAAAERKPLTDGRISELTGIKPDAPIWYAIRNTARAVERAHGITDASA